MAVPLCVFPAVFIHHLFSGQNESASAHFFCSFWHPTKLIASEGIGVEGLVLFWQFFQKWPSIRWCIVLERDLSLLNSWLATQKNKKADATKVLKVCRVHYGLMQESLDGRKGPLLHNDFAAGLYVKMRCSCGTENWLLQNFYYINILSRLFSRDHVLLEWFG